MTYGAAYISPDNLYRYTLSRVWKAPTSLLTIIGLNPSTADADLDDPTIRRDVGFAKREGYGGLLKLNLYAYRATKPVDLWKAADPIGPENDELLKRAFRDAREYGWDVVAAWGANANPARANRVVSDAIAAGVDLKCFGVTKAGFPRHPLYLKADTPLESYLDHFIGANSDAA